MFASWISRIIILKDVWPIAQKPGIPAVKPPKESRNQRPQGALGTLHFIWIDSLSNCPPMPTSTPPCTGPIPFLLSQISTIMVKKKTV